MVGDYQETLKEQRQKSSRDKIFGYLRGIKPGWLIILGLIVIVLYQWYSQQPGKINQYIPFIIGGLILVLMALGKGSEEANWVTREEAERIIYARAKQEQEERQRYSDVPMVGDIIISHLGTPDYDRRTWFIPWFVRDAVTGKQAWFVGLVDCKGKGYLGSEEYPLGGKPIGKESGYQFRLLSFSRPETES